MISFFRDSSIFIFFKKMSMFFLKPFSFLFKEFFVFIKSYEFSFKAYIFFTFYIFIIMGIINTLVNGGITDNIEAYGIHLMKVLYLPLMFLRLFFGDGLWMIPVGFLLSGVYIYFLVVTYFFIVHILKKYVTSYIEEKMSLYLTINGYKKRKKEQEQKAIYKEILENAKKRGIDTSKYSSLTEKNS
ncbi:hypothetical protein OZY48_08470 [Aliarcobacter cryaerophilus]|uniref:hypothetical protein n=1 Tax=Aliarcobacter cryaerophilus TaxID=28198 RepID=UPI003BAE3D78